jgi:hypothetical protein
MHSQEMQLVLTRELAAIKLNRADRSVGALYRIPAFSRIRRGRPSMMSGMVEIEWQGESYAVFEQDLDTRACRPGEEIQPLRHMIA